MESVIIVGWIRWSGGTGYRSAARSIHGFLLACAASFASCAAPSRHEFREPAMGTEFRLVLYSSDAEQARSAARAAFERIHELDAAMSDYLETSELSRLSASSGSGEWWPVGEDLWRVLALAQCYSELSGGAFDVTVGPLVELWRRARRQGEPPDASRIERALASVGWRMLELDAASRSARPTAAGMKLDLGGIAKGYALDAALDVLAQHGIESALADDGGGIAVRRAPPGSSGWRVEIAPFAGGAAATEIELENASIATSGDANRWFEFEGRRYSHIVDPRSGLALTSRTAASVVAADATTADALATALCVLGPSDGLALALAQPGVEARIARETTSGVETTLTPGFERLILALSSASREPGSRP